jgi:hypothetical protein
MIRLHLDGDKYDPDHIVSVLAAAGIDAEVTVETLEAAAPRFEGELTDAQYETIRQMIRQEPSPEQSGLDKAVAKARRVLAGDDTFTAAQIQQAVARLIIHASNTR